MGELSTLCEEFAGSGNDGDSVALEGFTHLMPTVAAHEIVRQGRRDLTLFRMTPDLTDDQIIGMGCARKLIFSWGGNPGVGSLHRLRDTVEREWPRPLEIEEHSHAGMAFARGGRARRDRAAHRGGASRPARPPSEIPDGEPMKPSHADRPLRPVAEMRQRPRGFGAKRCSGTRQKERGDGS